MEHSIYIMRLSYNAALPLEDGPAAHDRLGEPRAYVPITSVPGTEEEAAALSAWVNTHQSMFLAIGAASTALTLALNRLEDGDVPAATRFLSFARDLRLASSVYTYLPTVDREVYERFLRPAMKLVRSSFSGVSSREAIAFSLLIKRARAAAPVGVSASQHHLREFYQARKECLDADATWWKMHLEAMHRMVRAPVSLAQQEFRRSVKEEGLNKSYSEFLATSLQVPESLDDYDRFFGCERGPVTSKEYVANLDLSLSLSDKHISAEEPYSRYRAALPGQVLRLCREGGCQWAIP